MRIPRRIFISALASWALLFTNGFAQNQAAAAPKAPPLKLLTIGNSFANDATALLPGIVTAAGKEILIGRANLGGCTMERHVKHLTAFEANPEDPLGRPYDSNFSPKREEPGKKYSLIDLLQAEKWDYVTIQQVSNLSFMPETFEPFAGKLVETVKKYAPQAELVIHETWAYREDYPGFDDGKLNQKLMYDGLHGAYAALGKTYGLRVIPVGTAFQAARALPRWHFKFPDPAYDYKTPMGPGLPAQPGSLNVGWTWKKKPTAAVAGGPVTVKEGEPAKPPVEPKPAQPGTVSLDFKHANLEGRYLGATVWGEFLFKTDLRTVPFIPAGITPEDAETLRKVAHAAVSGS